MSNWNMPPGVSTNDIPGQDDRSDWCDPSQRESAMAKKWAEAEDKLREAEAKIEALRKDAERYRWLKSRKGLELRSEPQPNSWARMDGTTFSATHYLAEGGIQHVPADSLDATIDAAMKLRG